MIHMGSGIQVNNYKTAFERTVAHYEGKYLCTNNSDCNEWLIVMGIPGKVTLGSWKLLSSRVCGFAEKTQTKTLGNMLLQNKKPNCI